MDIKQLKKLYWSIVAWYHHIRYGKLVFRIHRVSGYDTWWNEISFELIPKSNKWFPKHVFERILYYS